MKLYEGKKCVACGKVFTENDDVVVCPECGAPHHKDCYKSLGKCAEADLHGTDKKWCDQNSANMVKPKKCDKCGALNKETTLNCSACGYNFNTVAEKDIDFDEEKQEFYEENNINNPEQFIKYGTMTEKDNVMGISPKEWAAFVGKSAYFYLTKFKKMATNGGNYSWNLGAFLFSFLFYFYRKLYKVGCILLLIVAMTFLPSLFLLNEFAEYYPTALDNEIISETPTTDEIYNVMTYMADKDSNPNADKFIFIMTLSNMMVWFRLGLSVAVGFTANKIYMNHAVKKIKYTRAALPQYETNLDYYKSLFIQGNVSFGMPVAIVFGCFAAASFIILGIMSLSLPI